MVYPFPENGNDGLIMDHSGAALAARYAYPPNSLSLCGPPRQHDLLHYAATSDTDCGTTEILSRFATMYPYLKLIAASNGIKDPLDKRVVEAYWIGNALLTRVPVRPYVHLLEDDIGLKKRISLSGREDTYGKIADGGLPHHSFHVMNVYVRTGNLDIPHTVETMDACIINKGTVEEILPGSFTVTTRPLRLVDRKLVFAAPLSRKIKWTNEVDEEAKRIRIGDTVAYHWGYLCSKLSPRQATNLEKYTLASLAHANASFL